MVTVTVTTTIELEQHKMCQEMQKKNEPGWGWSDLIRAGIASKVKPEVQEERIAELTAMVESLKRAVKHQRRLLPSMDVKL